MATCATSINMTHSHIEAQSGTKYTIDISTATNAIFVISSELAQSIFFNARVLGTNAFIAYSISVYKKNTLQLFGTVNITTANSASSFSTLPGEYYICVRPTVSSYQIEFTLTYISYSAVVTLRATSEFGFDVSCELSTARPESVCTRPLKYTLIDGQLPPGLWMNEAGHIRGTLPMLDCEPSNADYPPSNMWYQQFGDEEYVTNWGRAYRFKVHLTLKDDPSKEAEEWCYISIVNDYSKNISYVDSFGILEDEQISTFEEKIIVGSICPPLNCGNKTLLDLNTTRNKSSILYETFVLSDDVKNKIDRLLDLNNYDISILDASHKLMIENGITANDIYKYIELYVIDDDGEPLLLSHVDGKKYSNSTEQELIPIDTTIVPVYRDEPMFDGLRGTLSLVQYYIAHYNESNTLIDQLKDSCMFQTYLKENNIDSLYIQDYALSRFDYEDIIVNFTFTEEDEKTYYISLMNNNGIDETIADPSKKYNDIYNKQYNRLPLVIHNHFGIQCFVSRLL